MADAEADTMSGDAEDEQKKAEAAAAAEARRKRIMEKSRARMEKVSGLQQEADTEDEETKTSSAARMQAMRRRRFKKGKAKDEAKEGEKEATKPDATEAAKPAGTTTEEKAPEAAAAEEPKKEEPTPAPAPAPKVEEPKVAPKIEEVAETDEAADDVAGTKKKYKGVAKMRREKMPQKKKDEAAKAAEEEAKNPLSENAAVQARRQKRGKQPVLPILMYLLTTLLLFLAGLDVGLQHADESIVVNRDFAPNSFSIQKLNPFGSSADNAPIKDLGSDTDQYTRDLTEESDEFNTPDENAVDPNYVPNIDPLFRIDLDEMTRGPSFLNQLARGAVKVHRMFLFVFLDLPLQVFSLPAQLMSYPPVMCLAALAIRQLFGNIILGAKLPEAMEEDVRNSKEMTDILTMIKNVVTNTIVGAFPTAVSLYEGFKWLKTDMYVMLFGVFAGLLYSTWAMSDEAGLPPIGMEDSLISEADPPMEEVVMDGIADEL